MEKRLKRRIAAGAVIGLAVAGAGGAFAATRLGSPQATSQAIVDDAAKQLGIQPSKLSDALKKALENQVDAAVKDGTLTKAEGDAAKARIESGEVPLFFAPGLRGGHGEGPGFHHFGDLGAAAGYLGLTQAELRTQLESGKSLAQIAKDKGKSVDGLVQVLYDSAKTRLDAAVAAGRLTKDKEDAILGDLKQKLTDFVNRTPPKFGDRAFGPDRFGDRFGGRLGGRAFGDRMPGPGRFAPGRFGGARGYGPPPGFSPPTT
jgi:hypothetical protein